MKRYMDLIAAYPRFVIGVIGDIVADVYVMGTPERLSREAPVMVVRHEAERIIPGCAANTMNNLLTLGCGILPVSYLGDDRYGDELRHHFLSRGVSLEGLVDVPGMETVSKTRVMVGDVNRSKQQVIRIDREPPDAPDPSLAKKILDRLLRLNDRVDAWLVSDYDYFPFNEEIASALTAMAKEKPLVVDSHYRSRMFKGARCMTPNEGEALETAGRSLRESGDFTEIGFALMEELESDSLIITRGNRGMLVFDRPRSMTRVPTVGSDEIVDVNGAGDTVAATVTASLVAGAETAEAARLASCAASVVVMKTGAAVCTPDELRERLGLLGSTDDGD